MRSRWILALMMGLSLTAGAGSARGQDVIEFAVHPEKLI
jgi:hypothetical protein